MSEESKKRLKQEYAPLNPAEIKRNITKLQSKLIKLQAFKKQLREERVLGYPETKRQEEDFEYI